MTKTKMTRLRFPTPPCTSPTLVTLHLIVVANDSKGGDRISLTFSDQSYGPFAFNVHQDTGQPRRGNGKPSHEAKLRRKQGQFRLVKQWRLIVRRQERDNDDEFPYPQGSLRELGACELRPDYVCERSSSKVEQGKRYLRFLPNLRRLSFCQDTMRTQGSKAGRRLQSYLVHNNVIEEPGEVARVERRR